MAAGDDMGRGPLAGLLLQQALRLPLLLPEEERALARRAAAGDVDAAERLILRHLRCVFAVARRYVRFGLPVNDLVQEGTLGLIRAVRKFDPERDNRLATYAMWWIRAAIQDYVVRSWSLVRVGKTAPHKALFFNLKAQAARLPKSSAEGLGDDVLGGLARRFGLPLAEVAGLARRIAGFDQPLDAPLGHGAGDDGGATLADRLAADQPTPEEVAAANGMARLWTNLLDGALAMLPAREAAIIRERYLNDAARTFEAIGRDLGLSKDRVRQLEKRAIERLRELLGPFAAAHGLPG